jgi:hypothetical protein
MAAKASASLPTLMEAAAPVDVDPVAVAVPDGEEVEAALTVAVVLRVVLEEVVLEEAPRKRINSVSKPSSNSCVRRADSNDFSYWSNW